MRRAITTLGLLLSAALTVAAVVWWQSSTAAPEAPSVDPAVDGIPAPRGMEPAPPTDGQQGPAGGPRVWIEVQARAEVWPAPPPDIEVTRSGERVPAEAEVIAGSGDGWPLDRADDGPALVRVRLAAAVVHRRVVRKEDAPLRVEIGPDRQLRGRVVDAAARPVEGAPVWCGGSDDQVVATDVDGRFTADVPAGSGVPVVVRARGMAWKCAFVDVDLHAGGDVSLSLVDEVVRTVQVTGEELPLRGSSVALLPVDDPTTELQAFPFFAAVPLRIDADGRATLRGLPANAAVGIAVFGPAVPRTPSRTVSLRARTPAVEVQVPSSPALRGRAVDERGEPVAGAEVWAFAEARAPRDHAFGPWLLPIGIPNAGVAVAVSDAAGDFVLALPAARTVVAARRPGGVRSRMVVATGTRELQVVLPHTLTAPGTLTVPPPEPGVAWSVRVDPWTEGRFVDVAADQPFALPLPTPVVADLRVRREANDGAWSDVRVANARLLDAAFSLPVELMRR